MAEASRCADRRQARLPEHAVQPVDIAELGGDQDVVDRLGAAFGAVGGDVRKLADDQRGQPVGRGDEDVVQVQRQLPLNSIVML